MKQITNRVALTRDEHCIYQERGRELEKKTKDQGFLLLTDLTMKLIKLNNGNFIPAIGLGCYDLPRTHTATIVYEALNIGYRHFDTAVLYGNEYEVGQGIRKWLDSNPATNKREDVFYTTKLWNSELGYTNTKRAIESMMEKVDHLKYIDLILIHSPLPGRQKRLESWKALQEAVEAGLVKNIGVSNYGEKHIDELLAWPELKVKPVINQIEISPWIMRQQLADYTRSKDIVVEAYAPLTHGYKLSNPSPQMRAICDKYGVDVAQVLIRWSIQKQLLPLPKTKTISRLKSNLDVYGFELTAEEMDVISQPDSYDPTDWECTDCP